MSDRLERLDALETLMASDAWQALRGEMVEQQLSLSREMVDGFADFVKYREAAAQHRQIRAILTWPERMATQLRTEIEQEEGTG